jgi:ketosteroid isomerase-like protein
VDTHAIVRDMYDAYERRDFARVAALLHDDIDWVIYAPPEVLPFAGAQKGRVAVLKVMGAITLDYDLLSYQPQLIIVEGDRAAVMSNAAFRQRASGRTLRFRIANFLRFQDGKLIEFREFANTFDMVEQVLGHALRIS